jgi:putative cobalt transporter subunit CbtA
MNPTLKGFLLRGLAAGAAGGLVAALFIRIVTETQIGFALQFEDATGLGGPPGEPAEFTRTTQFFGGMLAAIIYGAILGVVLAVAVAALHHRIAAHNEFGRVARVAGAVFVAVVLIPGLKYPPNPPTVGNPDTIGERTRLFLSLMGASIVFVFAAWFLWEYLSQRGVDGAPRFMAVAGAFGLVVTLAFVLWPASPDPINPPDSEAAPALQIADDAPDDVLAGMLDNARATDDTWIRDPADPDQPLDLDDVDDPSELAGAPAAVNTTKLVPHAYTTMLWHFRVESFAGLALMLTVMASVLGLLLDLQARAHASALEPAAAGPSGAGAGSATGSSAGSGASTASAVSAVDPPVGT